MSRVYPGSLFRWAEYYCDRARLWWVNKKPHTEEELAYLDRVGERLRIPLIIDRIKNNLRDRESFSFMVIGDMHGDFRITVDCIQEIRARQPDFVISLGDSVRRGRVEEYLASYLRIIDMLYPIPLLSVPGNHERGPDGKYTAYLRLHQTDHFVLNLNSTAFVGFNNNHFWSFTPKELRFLAQSLATQDAQYKFIFMHKPPRFLSVFRKGSTKRGVRWNTGRFQSLMKQLQVTEICMGHIHGFVTTQYDGIRYTISGGGGAFLEKELKDEQKVHHFLHYQVTPTGVVRQCVQRQHGQWLCYTF